jgi:hypothetical protein
VRTPVSAPPTSRSRAHRASLRHRERGRPRDCAQRRARSSTCPRRAARHTHPGRPAVAQCPDAKRLRVEPGSHGDVRPSGHARGIGGGLSAGFHRRIDGRPHRIMGDAALAAPSQRATNDTAHLAWADRTLSAGRASRLRTRHSGPRVPIHARGSDARGKRTGAPSPWDR